MNEIERTPPNIREKVISDLFPLFPHAPIPISVTETTIRRWMIGYIKAFVTIPMDMKEKMLKYIVKRFLR